jgi:hypothetical protein
MSELAKQLFDSLKAGAEALAPGLSNAGQEIGAEMQRLGTQGSMELASALFNGSGFVPYGPGQYTPDVQHEQGHAQDQGHSQSQEQEMSHER